jgi:uncharacterized protein YdcH (DUF465 family)
LEGHPEYSAKVLQTLYINAMLGKKTIDYSSVLAAISFRVLENRAYLDELISKLKIKKHHFEVIYEMANGLGHTVDSATLYNTRVSLENMGLIEKVQKGEYKLVDIFLKILLQQHDDKMVALEGRLDIGLEFVSS